MAILPRQNSRGQPWNLPYAGYIHDTAPFEASNAAVVITILVQDRASIIPDL